MDGRNIWNCILLWAKLICFGRKCFRWQRRNYYSSIFSQIALAVALLECGHFSLALVNCQLIKIDLRKNLQPCINFTHRTFKSIAWRKKLAKINHVVSTLKDRTMHNIQNRSKPKVIDLEVWGRWGHVDNVDAKMKHKLFTQDTHPSPRLAFVFNFSRKFFFLVFVCVHCAVCLCTRFVNNASWKYTRRRHKINCG